MTQVCREEAPRGFYRVFAITYSSYVIMYVLRKVASISKPFMKDDLDFVTDTTLGNIDSAFFFAYSIFQFFAGALADTFGARIVISIAFLVTSAGALLFRTGWGAGVMIAAWAIEGLGHAPGFSCLFSSTVKYLPVKTASSWTAVWTTSQQVGSIVTTVLGTWLCKRFGWKSPYSIFGIFTAVMGCVCFFGLPNSKKEKELIAHNKRMAALNMSTSLETREALSEIAKAETASENVTKPEVKKLNTFQIFVGAMKIKGIIPACFCAFFVKTIKYCLMMWLPSLLRETVEGCDSSVAGYASSLYEIAGIVGALGAGAVADAKFMRGRRLMVGTVSCAAMVVMSIVTFFCAPHQEANLILLLIMFFIIGNILCAMDMIFGSTAPVELVNRHKKTGDPHEYQATVMSICNGFGSGGGIFQSQVTPWLVRRTNGQWKYVILFLGGCAFLALLVSLTFIWDKTVISDKVQEEKNSATALKPRLK